MIAPCKLPIAVFKSVPCCLTVFTPAIFDALTQLNTPQKAKLKEQVGQANRLEDVQSVQTNGQS
ncbi:GA module-containing protein, partial [Staphylococcus aureus]|uniref:GA module-containing protein n=1 Tax=Staphylococcus aureus TaxID=1280 RepID=UPI0011551DEB